MGAREGLGFRVLGFNGSRVQGFKGFGFESLRVFMVFFGFGVERFRALLSGQQLLQAALSGAPLISGDPGRLGGLYGGGGWGCRV